MHIEHYKIEELSMAASFQLLEQKIPFRIKLRTEEKEEIAKLTGNVPLALEIVGSILRLPDSPSPTVLINELKSELIETLSPEDFPVDKQVFTVINLSYKYLPKELQRISCQLTIFPGSFTLPAAFAVCNSSTEATVGRISNTERTKKFSAQLKSLIRNSLLEYSQRADRYHYHRLIKEYFLLIQRKHWPDETASLLPAFHMYYSRKLSGESISFRYRHDYEQPLAFLDSEQHNLEYLLDNLKEMQSISHKSLDIEEFLRTAYALISATVNANFLQMRFSIEKCCALLNSTLEKLDKMMPYLQYYLRDQSFKMEDVLRYYVAIIGQVAKCEMEKHGVWEAMLIFSARKIIVESMSAVMSTLTYINFYSRLGHLYMQLGTEFKMNSLECYWLILNRTHAHQVNCQPNYCTYSHFGEAYSEMGQYREASIFFEDELLKGSKYVMQRIRILVWLIYLYSYMDEYDKMVSSIARLHDCYSDIASLPPIKMIYDSDATLIFIQFYKQAELFNEAQWLENRFYDGLLELKEIVRAAFHEKSSEHWESYLAAPLKVLPEYFEAGNYSTTAEIGSFIIGLIEDSDSFNDTKIKLHLLVGKAKFHMGQFSDGMDHTELALQGILNIGGGFESERWTACWYLIPRMTYLDTCYQIKRMVIIGFFGHVILIGAGLFLILTPFPFYTYEETKLQLAEKPIITHHQLSHGTTLASTAGDLGLFDSYSKWLVMIPSQLTEAVSGVKVLFELIKNLLKLPFIRFARNLFHFIVCVLFVWIKLICVYLYIKIRWFQQPAKPWIADYYVSYYAFYAFALVKLLYNLICFRSFVHAKDTVRMLRDPRFRYGEDETPHSNFLDSVIIEDDDIVVVTIYYKIEIVYSNNDQVEL